MGMPIMDHWYAPGYERRIVTYMEGDVVDPNHRIEQVLLVEDIPTYGATTTCRRFTVIVGPVATGEPPPPPPSDFATGRRK